MLHRDLRSAVIVLSTLISTGALCVGPPAVVEARAADLTLEFEDVAPLVREQSPRAGVLAAGLAGVEAERRGALAWSNPGLAFERESVGGEREWQIGLSKRLDRPFSRGALRGAWDDRVSAATLHAEQGLLDLTARLQAGYVRLRLLDDALARLDALSAMVDRVRGVAAARHQAGEASGLERRLIELSAAGLEAERRLLRREREDEAAVWYAELGLPGDATVTLATPVAFAAVDLAPLDEYTRRLAAQPGPRAGPALVRSLQREAEAARPGPVPGMEIFGGYKSVGDGGDGLVLGAAVDLPLFDRGEGESGRLAAAGVAARHESDLALLAARRELDVLVQRIAAEQPVLAALAAPLETVADPGETLLLSYREGSLSLDSLLNAIQIEASALGVYRQALTAHYQDLFRLEALTGSTVAPLER